MGNFLEPIRARKLGEAAALGTPEAKREMEQRIDRAPPPRDFRSALSGGQGYRIIAEIKKASPSRGVLCADFRPGRIAALYREGGAAALSVLTDGPDFQGSPAHLEEARSMTNLPVLRKDFIVDSSQVAQSRAMGADAVLLIVSLLPSPLLGRLVRDVRDLGMAPLVEIHDEAELGEALDAGADLVGVNNRDLKTLRVDPGVSLRLAERIPPAVLAVTESGIQGRDDLELLSRAGYRAFLIGERLMSSADPRALLKEWTQ